jgi:hypothetical protein
MLECSPINLMLTKTFRKNHEVQLSSCEVIPIVGVDLFINEIHS